MKADTYKITLLKKETGETREVVFQPGWDEVAEYMWTGGGNYSCDCNRHFAFESALYLYEEGDEVPCGETLYRALRVELPDGTLIELESA